MDPITMSAIAALATTLATKAVDKSFEATVELATQSGWQWLKSLLWKDSVPTASLQQLIDKPESPARLQAVQAVIAANLEDNPANLQFLQDVIAALKDSGSISIHQENVVNGPITAGGDVIVGNNNKR